MLDTEAALLIDDNEAKISEGNLVLDQGVSTNDKPAAPLAASSMA